MEDLSLNEQILLEKIRQSSEDGVYETGVRDIDVEIKQKRWSYHWVDRKASHMGIVAMLKRLEKKGYITITKTEDKIPKSRIVINHYNETYENNGNSQVVQQDQPGEAVRTD